MMKKIVQAVLTVTLLLFAALNAYLALKDVVQTQKIVAQTTQTSTLQANISTVLKDLTDMETGQRGYLLTGDDSYLQPYSEASAHMPTHLANLRTGLAQRPESERSLQPEIESLAKSKRAEMERSISWRQYGERAKHVGGVRGAVVTLGARVREHPRHARLSDIQCHLRL